MLPIGMGAPLPGRIPWRDVMAWADRHGHAGDTEIELLDECIIAMDDVYLPIAIKQRQEADRRNGNAPRRHR